MDRVIKFLRSVGVLPESKRCLFLWSLSSGMQMSVIATCLLHLQRGVFDVEAFGEQRRQRSPDLLDVRDIFINDVRGGNSCREMSLFTPRATASAKR